MKKNSSSNELTLAISYNSDSTDSGNGIVHYFEDVSTSNVETNRSSTTAFVPNFDLTKNFNSPSNSTYSDGYGGAGDYLIDMDFMEFGSTDELGAFLRSNEVNKSTLFTLETNPDDSNQLWVYRASQRKSGDRLLFDAPKIKGSNNKISVAYQKQPDNNSDLPPFINNWKGTPSNSDRAASSKHSSNFRDFALTLTGKADTSSTYN